MSTIELRRAAAVLIAASLILGILKGFLLSRVSA